MLYASESQTRVDPDDRLAGAVRRHCLCMQSCLREGCMRHACPYVCVHARMRACMRACLCVFVCVCVCVCMCVLFVCISVTFIPIVYLYLW